MAKKVKVGIIGSGGIAQSVHMPGYAKDPDVEIVAVCDNREETAKEAAEKFEVPKTYLDYRELAQDPDVEAVSVCTPNYLHMEPTVACLENGKHVLVEKPIARNAEEGAAMVRAARKSGKLLAVGLHFHFDPRVQMLRRFRDSGGFGEIYFARIHILRRRGIPSWGVFGDKEKQGGGPLVDLGVHILYAALYVLDFPKPLTVSGATYTKFGDRPPGVAPWGPWDYKGFTVEDYASAYVRFDTGLTMSLEASFAVNNENVMNFWIMGDKGGAKYEPCTVYREEFGTLTDTVPGWMPKGEAHLDEIKAFLKAVRGEGEVGVSGEKALLVTRILDAIYASADAGREVEVKEMDLGGTS